MIKICKISFIILAVVFSLFSATESFAASDVIEDVTIQCKDYPGFINKIVKCITHIVSKEVVEGSLDRVHEVFVQVSNAALILYIMFFGAKLMLGGVDKAKSEIFTVCITAMLVMYMNNTTKIMDVVDMFILGQSEFANAATAAITTAPLETSNATGDFICTGPYKSVGTYPNNSLKPIDDAGNEVAPDSPNRAIFTTWQRVDCIIGYLLGAHPLVEKTAQIYEENVTEEDDYEGKQKYSYEMFASKDNPFANMAEDPFQFLQDPTKAKVSGGKEQFLSFSMIAIIVGTLFSEEMGLVMALTGIFIILLLISAFGQAVLIYVTSLFAIIVLALFSPIIIPCFLFKFTRKIFDFWIQMFFTYMLQPGIMLCYLSFMLFVTQYVMTYETTFVYDDPNCDPVTETNCNEIEIKKSLIDYHFGDGFKNADNESRDLVSMTQNISTSFQENGQNLMQSTQRKMNAFNDFKDASGKSIISSATAQRDDGARGVAERGKIQNTVFQTFTGTSTNFSQMNSSSLKVPYFKFARTEDADTQKKLTDMMSSMNMLNPSEFLREFQNDPDAMAELADVESIGARQDYQNTMAYMQLLLIVFLTLSVTYAFMQNVMAFGSEMAGAGTIATSQMVNIYNSMTTKMANSVGDKPKK